jgi:hypothetical protein
MGWRRAANVHLNSATTIPKGSTMLAVWDASQGDDLGVSWDREAQCKKTIPTSGLQTGHTAHVVVQ